MGFHSGTPGKTTHAEVPALAEHSIIHGGEGDVPKDSSGVLASPEFQALDGPGVLDWVTFAAWRTISSAVSTLRDLWGRADRIFRAGRRGCVIG